MKKLTILLCLCFMSLTFLLVDTRPLSRENVDDEKEASSEDEGRCYHCNGVNDESEPELSSEDEDAKPPFGENTDDEKEASSEDVGPPKGVNDDNEPELSSEDEGRTESVARRFEDDEEPTFNPLMQIGKRSQGGREGGGRGVEISEGEDAAVEDGGGEMLVLD